MKAMEKKPISDTNLRKAGAQRVYVLAWNVTTSTVTLNGVI